MSRARDRLLDAAANAVARDLGPCVQFPREAVSAPPDPPGMRWRGEDEDLGIIAVRFDGEEPIAMFWDDSAEPEEPGEWAPATEPDYARCILAAWALDAEARAEHAAKVAAAERALRKAEVAALELSSAIAAGFSRTTEEIRAACAELERRLAALCALGVEP